MWSNIISETILVPSMPSQLEEAGTADGLGAAC